MEAVFDPKRRSGNKSAEAFRCEASEGLSVYPLLRFWVSALVRTCDAKGYCQAACQAYLAFCDIADCMVTMACRTITPAALRQAVAIFLDLFTKAWPTEPFTPKLHWLLHYSEELQAHGTLFSCFVHERKHKVIKRYGNLIANTRSAAKSNGFEETVLSEVTCHHIAMLKNFDTINCGLVCL